MTGRMLTPQSAQSQYLKMCFHSAWTLLSESSLESFNQPTVLQHLQNLLWFSPPILFQTMGSRGFSQISASMLGPRLAKLSKPFSGRLKPFITRKMPHDVDAQCLGHPRSQGPQWRWLAIELFGCDLMSFVLCFG